MFKSVCLLLLKTMIVDSAPKLGPVLFDPLLFEASKVFRDEVSNIKLDVNIKASRQEKEGVLKENFDASDDYLENKETSREEIKSTSPPLLTVHEDKKSNVQETREKSTTLINNNEPFTLLSILRRDLNSGRKQSSALQQSGYDYDPAQCKHIKNRILCGYDKNIETGDTAANPDTIVEIGDRCHVRGDRIECGYLEPPFANFAFPPLTSQQLNAHIKAKYVLRDQNSETKNKTDEIRDEHSKNRQDISLSTSFNEKVESLVNLEDQGSKTERKEPNVSKISKTEDEESATVLISAESSNESETNISSLESPSSRSSESFIMNATTNISLEHLVNPTKTKTKTRRQRKHRFGNTTNVLTEKGSLEKNRRANLDISNSKTENPVTNAVPLVTKCVEKADRIVCYPIPGSLRLGEIPSACKTC